MGTGHVDEIPWRVRDGATYYVGLQLENHRVFLLKGGVVVERPAAVKVDVLQQFLVGEEAEAFQLLDTLFAWYSRFEPE